MTEDDRAVAHPEIDVLVPVQVPDPAAFASIEIDRVVAPGPEVRVRAAGKTPQRPRVHFLLPGPLEGGSRKGGGFGGHDRSTMRLIDAPATGAASAR